MAPNVPLRLTLIEGFALWRGSEELRIATSGQRLIALLALRDRPAGRLHVAGTLWPDCSDGSFVGRLAYHAVADQAVLRSRDHGQPVVSSGSMRDIEVDVRNLVAFARRLNQAGASVRDSGPGFGASGRVWSAICCPTGMTTGCLTSGKNSARPGCTHWRAWPGG